MFKDDISQSVLLCKLMGPDTQKPFMLSICVEMSYMVIATLIWNKSLVESNGISYLTFRFQTLNLITIW